jgi:signal transduction histidine kinase
MNGSEPDHSIEANPARRSALRYVPIYAVVLAVTLLHYLTGHELHHYHGIYRRLYYIPIILAAFAGGIRGALVAASVVCLVYLPHAFGLGPVIRDPAPPVEKVLEMVLYLVVALISGSLVSREARTQRRLRETADSLTHTLQEKRRMEEELIRAAKLAAVGRLSAGLAHEIRNPLASIKGAAELLGDDYPEENPKRRLLDALVGESDRLDKVLSRFLAFARPAPPERRDVDLQREATEVVALIRAQKEGRETDIRVEPPPGPLSQVLSDPEQLRQVIWNLLLNSIQATAGRGTIHVRFGEERGPARVLVIVEDDGPGFTDEAVENLFTPFYTTREEGSGLGLAISHRIAESHGGSIRVENRAEGGARVSLVLPTAE